MDGPRSRFLDQPVPAKEWFENNIPDDGLLWKSGPGQQLLAGQRFAAQLMACERGDDGYVFDQWKHKMLHVVSTHHSKSVTLPVMFMEWKGIKFYWRDNFYDIKLSVDAGKKHIGVDFEDIFRDEDHSSCYFEGFSGDWIFGSYRKSNQRWSMSLGEFAAKFVLRKIWRHVRVAEQIPDHPIRVIREFVDWLPPDLNVAYRSDESVAGALLEEADIMEKSPNFLHGYDRVSTIMSLAFNRRGFGPGKDLPQDVQDACYTKMFGRPRFKDDWELKREKEAAEKEEQAHA